MGEPGKGGPSLAQVRLAPQVRIEGEECSRCLEEARDRLLSTPGVQAVDPEAGFLRVEYDPQEVSPEELERVGHRSPGDLEHLVVPIRGMDCPDCALTIEAAAARMPGVRFASLNFGAQRLLLEYDPAQVGLAGVERAIRRLGYRVPGREETERERLFDLRHSEVRGVLASGVLLALGGALSLAPGLAPAAAPTFSAAALSGAWTPLRRALGALRLRRVDMNCLMILATAGALALGDFAEAATVIFLFSVGEMLEGFAARRSRRAVERLLEHRPEVARVQRQGAEVEVPARDVSVGEVVYLRPGEQVPLDGRVVGGRSSVNQASVTGESIPVDKAVGDGVFAGTLNESGALRIEVTAPYERSTLARVLDVVEQAQARKSERQRFVDRFAARYTPAVVVGALLVALLGPFLDQQPFTEWLYRALVLLVIACPCALVISTPVSVVSALTGALRHGILIKGGVYLERLARARAFALDKTGTLTRGSLQVGEVSSLGELPPQRVLALAAAVESHSEHPLGVALVRHARAQGIVPGAVEEFQALPGRGAWGVVDGAAVEVGRPELFDSHLGPDCAGRIEELRRRGQTVVVVVRDGQPVGLVSFADAPRVEARQALDELRSLGQRLVLLTGDHPRAAAPLASHLGLEEVHAGLLPEGKLAVLRRLEEDGFPVVMVGDGINDSPALAAATVGVSLGAAGTAVALETADVALMGDDLRGLPVALRLARRAEAVIAQNIALSLVTKVVFLTLALLGKADRWMAIAADRGASLLVTANGLRLVGATPPPSPGCAEPGCGSGACCAHPAEDPGHGGDSCCGSGGKSCCGS